MKRLRSTLGARNAVVVGIVLATSVFVAGGTASATPTPVGLGTATSYAVFAGANGASNITNGQSGTRISGDVGLPGPFAKITGLVCANMTAGTMFSTDGAGPAPCSGTDPGTTVENDARASFKHVSLLPGATTIAGGDLAGDTLVAGLYSLSAPVTNLPTGTTLTLNAQGDPNAVWIFQASSTLITSSATTMQFINVPDDKNFACNVFWKVGSSATIGASSTFVGTILASASITVNGPVNGGTATIVNGRLLAANQASDTGSVTIPGLATITRPAGCPTLPAGTGGGTAGGTTTTTTAVAATPVGSSPRFTG